MTCDTEHSLPGLSILYIRPSYDGQSRTVVTKQTNAEIHNTVQVFLPIRSASITGKVTHVSIIPMF